MARPPLYDEETIARVEAALIAGQTPTAVSRLYGLPRTTVIKIRSRMSSTVTKETEVSDASLTSVSFVTVDDIRLRILMTVVRGKP